MHPVTVQVEMEQQQMQQMPTTSNDALRISVRESGALTLPERGTSTPPTIGQQKTVKFSLGLTAMTGGKAAGKGRGKKNTK